MVMVEIPPDVASDTIFPITGETCKSSGRVCVGNFPNGGGSGSGTRMKWGGRRVLTAKKRWRQEYVPRFRSRSPRSRSFARSAFIPRLESFWAGGDKTPVRFLHAFTK